MLTATRGDLAPGLEVWRSLLERDFGEHDRARSAPLDERLSAPRGADVPHPLRTVPEHRDEIALATTRTVVRRRPLLRSFTCNVSKIRGVRPSPDIQAQAPLTFLPRRGRAPVSVELAQVTASFGRISAQPHGHHAPSTRSCGVLVRTAAQPSGSMRLRQLVQQRLCVFEVVRVKTLGEPAVDRGESCCVRSIAILRSTALRSNTSAHTVAIPGCSSAVKLFARGLFPICV